MTPDGVETGLELPTSAKRRARNIGRIMVEGLPPVPMTLDEWLTEGDLVWMHAEAAAGKTMIALALSLAVMRTGERVVYLDEELGASDITRRLLALGADVHALDKNGRACLYLPILVSR